ncbi:hypothetical protein [Enterobacter ludwigii]|uniref:hypothetical protein n=1 Tax=Enterobacter ludwigii TaxID=299767 RepID=UPI00110B800A|nr:hypothetical protein [Enterobacter ludwigii]MDP9945694.1 hypothetical protein [Enterobacter ludwigii]QCV81416.1 hypothetical protein ELLBI42_18520 [Enterobacter ludwigii]QDE51591.1 hypothetical protein ECI140_18520 [Enterobacter ludwigii]WFY39736.1 hypothetical protein NFK33_18320 [Enterobacter ludwigii]
MSSSSAYWYEPRAAFYTENRGKLQKINARVASAVRKNFQQRIQLSERLVKKSWKSGEELT